MLHETSLPMSPTRATQRSPIQRIPLPVRFKSERGISEILASVSIVKRGHSDEKAQHAPHSRQLNSVLTVGMTTSFKLRPFRLPPMNPAQLLKALWKNKRHAASPAVHIPGAETRRSPVDCVCAPESGGIQQALQLRTRRFIFNLLDGGNLVDQTGQGLFI
jgi:hypothetical protein